MQINQAILILNVLDGAGVTVSPTDRGTLALSSKCIIPDNLVRLARENKSELLDYFQSAANDTGHADDQADAADREGDDRRMCMECANLQGGSPRWRCSRPRAAELGSAELPAELTTQPQRCPAFQPAPLAIEKGVPPSTVTAAPAAEKAAARAKTTSSNAKTAEETALMAARLARFAELGLAQAAANKLADRLLARDRKADKKHCCAECARLSSKHNGAVTRFAAA